MRSRELLDLRNKQIKQRYEELVKKQPQWRYDAILREMEKEFYVSSVTIQRILNKEEK